MIPKPLTQIEKADVDTLVANSISESRTLDCKRETWKDGKEIAKDLAAFANAHGGDILIGVEEKSGEAIAAPGVNINIDQEIIRVQQVAEANITAKLPKLEFVSIPGFEKGPVLIVRVAKSWLRRPHAVKLGDGGFRFFIRRDRHAQPMDFEEVQQMFLATAELPEKVRSFRDARVNAFLNGPANATPVPMRERKIFFLHLIAANSFAPGMAVDVRNLQNEQVPMLIERDGLRRFTLDGYVRFLSQPSQYVEFRRNLIIEAALEGSHWLAEKSYGGAEKHLFLYDKELSDALRRTLPRYLQLLKSLGAETPIFVLASALNVRGAAMPPRQSEWFDPGPENTILRDHLLFPEQIIEEFGTDTDAIVDDLRRLIWQSAGHPDFRK